MCVTELVHHAAVLVLLGTLLDSPLHHTKDGPGQNQAWPQLSGAGQIVSEGGLKYLGMLSISIKPFSGQHHPV